MKKMLYVPVLLAFVLALIASRASVAAETAGEKIDDSVITAEVNAAIAKDPDARRVKIDVSSHDGDVVLTGVVADKDTMTRIVDNVKEIKGVKSVTNQLKLYSVR